MAAGRPSARGRGRRGRRAREGGLGRGWRDEEQSVSIALVGRPNVGKSSLLNSLLGEDRAIVSEIPGTTRDAIDTHLAWGRSEIVLIDTAGIRRPGKVSRGPDAERYSTLRALKAVDRADVAILVIDAFDGLTAQDAHVAGFVAEEGRGLVIALNKWDLLAEKTDRTFDEVRRRHAPPGAVPGLRAVRLNQRQDRPARGTRAGAGRRRLGRAPQAHPDAGAEPPRSCGRSPPGAAAGKLGPPKIFYATQVAVAPPTFVFFARHADQVHFSYQRFLENQLREEFGFDGTPIKLIFRERPAADPEANAEAATAHARVIRPARFGEVARRGQATRDRTESACRPDLRAAAGPPGSRAGPLLAIWYSVGRRGVAQPGSAPEWGSGGRAFESLRPDHYLDQE